MRDCTRPLVSLLPGDWDVTLIFRTDTPLYISPKAKPSLFCDSQIPLPMPGFATVLPVQDPRTILPCQTLPTRFCGVDSKVILSSWRVLAASEDPGLSLRGSFLRNSSWGAERQFCVDRDSTVEAFLSLPFLWLPDRRGRVL